MSLASILFQWRRVLLIPLALSALASAPAFAQRDVIIINQPPPPMRMEPMPPARHGYAWDQGHWRWEGRGYVWQPGHWQPVHYGARWMPGHWQAHGPNWRWVEGHWVR